MQPLPKVLPAPSVQQVVADPLPYINPPNPPNYPMASPSLVTEDLFYYTPASPSFSATLDPYDSLIDQPPPSILPSEASSALPSETSSALASDSDLPSLSSTKAVKQTDLLNFFSKMPSKEYHGQWQKRKRDNQDRDREEHAKRKQKDEAEKLRKLAKKRANNQVSQKKRRDRLKEEKAILSEAGQDPSVSSLIYTL